MLCVMFDDRCLPPSQLIQHETSNSLSHPEEVGVLAHALEGRPVGVLEVSKGCVAVRYVFFFAFVVPTLH